MLELLLYDATEAKKKASEWTLASYALLEQAQDLCEHPILAIRECHPKFGRSYRVCGTCGLREMGGYGFAYLKGDYGAVAMVPEDQARKLVRFSGRWVEDK